MPYELINPISDSPIIVSVPHSGIKIPHELKSSYVSGQIQFIDDTDWFVDRLYDFVQDMGITIIHAKYSRWVIDLNRNVQSKPLYDDGRIITDLTPTTDFNGQSIYKNKEPSDAEIQKRISSYYTPYYDNITTLIKNKKSTFDHVLFFDAHSIRKHVPGIRKEPFPDLILGDVDETSADKGLIETAVKTLGSSSYSFQHNDPFKGGNLTRHFANPKKGIHALQLEMSKILYMYDTETLFHEERAEKVRTLLRSLFQNLSESLNQLNNQ